MRRRWYLVPVAVFIVSFLVAGSMALQMRLAIKTVMDAAAKNDWPVIVTESGDPLFPHGIYTLDGRGGLLTTLTMPKMPQHVLFADDGALLAFTSSAYRSGRSIYFRIGFPDYRPHRVRMPSANVPKEYRRSYWNSIRESPRYAWGSFGTPSDMIILDALSGNATVLRFKAGRPWSDDTVDSQVPIWTDKTDMLVMVQTRNSAAASSGAPPRTDSLWRYDGSAGTWTRLAEGSFTGAAIGQDGRIIALGISSPPSLPRVDFMDATTGQVLHTVDGAYQAAIGRRWAACTRFFAPRKSREILLFDMANSWESHKIVIRKNVISPVKFGGLAIYEPGASGSRQ